MKSLGVCYWYVKMPGCGCMKHGLDYCIQKHLGSLFWSPAGSRQAARICETPLLS